MLRNISGCFGDFRCQVFFSSYAYSNNLQFHSIMPKTIEIESEDDIFYSGRWEQSEGHFICRWIVFWTKIQDCFVGSVGVHSVRGPFVLEKFHIEGGAILLDSYEEFTLLSEDLIEVAEVCKSYCLLPHDKSYWSNFNKLVLKVNPNLAGDLDSFIEGDELPEEMVKFFKDAGLMVKLDS